MSRRVGPQAFVYIKASSGWIGGGCGLGGLDRLLSNSRRGQLRQETLLRRLQLQGGGLSREGCINLREVLQGLWAPDWLCRQSLRNKLRALDRGVGPPCC